jgi:hypothetical protein
VPKIFKLLKLPLQSLLPSQAFTRQLKYCSFIQVHFNGPEKLLKHSGPLSTGERPLEESKQYCAFLLESALAGMPAGTETILGIFDLRGFGHRNADLGFVRFLVRGPLPYGVCLEFLTMRGGGLQDGMCTSFDVSLVCNL